MRIPAIPPFLRQEAVTLERQAENGFEPPVEIARCRVDRSARLSPNDYQLTAGCSARVFVDATEYGGEIREGDLISFDGDRHAAASVTRCDNPDGTPHHWEVDVA